ncbi:MAG: hypothetical protein WBM40_13580, partial [Thiohalocapsa sp.]
QLPDTDSTHTHDDLRDRPPGQSKKACEVVRDSISALAGPGINIYPQGSYQTSREVAIIPQSQANDAHTTSCRFPEP